MKRPLRIALFGVAALAAIFGVGLAIAYAAIDSLPERRIASDGPNALWLGHDWVGKIQKQDAYNRLAARLRRHRITDVYVHVGPLEADGRIRPSHFPAAKALVREMHDGAGGVRLQAWMGQADTGRGSPPDLSKASVRVNIWRTAGRFLELGFDGIHYNIEPGNGNPNYLELLAATRRMTRRRGRVLSIAANELEPLPGLAWLSGMLGAKSGYWSRSYYRAVTDNVDQVAVMPYDTMLPAMWMYEGFVAWQTSRARQLTRGRTQLLIGVPASDGRRLSFDDDAKKLRSALAGVRKGMGLREKDDFIGFGIAIYADWTTDAEEWRLYREMWLGAKSR
jgi:hypothetical protein